jgi:regulator of protease activity HflC (stomatin/prohibitin superfamily)
MMTILKMALLAAAAFGLLVETARAVRHRRLHWRLAAALGLAATLLVERSFVVVPSGMAGVRVSQLWGTRPGTLYPGIHFVRPIVETVALYSTREQILSGGQSASGRAGDVLSAQTREGLSVGLAVSVRYRIDPQRLAHIQADLPQPIETELVPPIVASVFRQVLPRYMVREVFSTRREEIRQQAADTITEKLKEDGIVVKEVMLRDVVLPAEYARSLEGLLLKEQENERMVYELQIREKEVRQAELQAEAQKARDVKAAEAQAQVLVLRAKAEADAMQHTLPLKEKQIQQSRLEAEAASAAKLIEGKAELERSRLMADAEANRIRVVAAANGERLREEALVLKDNPLLIQKIVAERLSDKMQIMMVPMDGKNFFASDVFRAASSFLNGAAAPQAQPETEQPETPQPKPTKMARRR